jgi:hypothetical protein
MKIGITGTRYAPSTVQLIELENELRTRRSSSGDRPELHHGDCVGVDHAVAVIADSMDYWIVCHPPIKNELRANYPSNEYMPPLNYFARNRALVDAVDILLVAPFQESRQNYGGTWYTYDYAVKVGRPTIVVLPSGIIWRSV